MTVMADLYGRISPDYIMGINVCWTYKGPSASSNVAQIGMPPITGITEWITVYFAMSVQLIWRSVNAIHVKIRATFQFSYNDLTEW